MANELEKLARKLGLLQSIGADAAKKWARRTREFEAQGKTSYQAAIFAAREVLPADYKDTRYNYQNDPIDELLTAIETLSAR